MALFYSIFEEGRRVGGTRTWIGTTGCFRRTALIFKVQEVGEGVGRVFSRLVFSKFPPKAPRCHITFGATFDARVQTWCICRQITQDHVQ